MSFILLILSHRSDKFSEFLITLFLIFSSLFIYSIDNTTPKKPRVSIITSVFKGEKFIRGFMDDIVRSTIFDQCELIIINAASPDNEDEVIQEYLTKYPNIIYKKLDHDPGIYAVWNMAIKMARANLITNANIDDRRNPESIEMQAKALEEDPTVDLVYNNFVISYSDNVIYDPKLIRLWADVKPFSSKNMCYCLPGPQPMWRKSFHEKYGYFDESLRFVGDYEMWLRAVSKGSKFKKISGFSGVYYDNPQSLTNKTENNHQDERQKEGIRSIKKYESMWQ